MLIINGVVIPHAVHAAEREGPEHDPIADWCREHGVELARPKGTHDPLHPPLQALRTRLEARVHARDAERKRVAERNARVAGTSASAPAKSTRVSRPASPAKTAPTPTAPTSDAAKAKE